MQFSFKYPNIVFHSIFLCSSFSEGSPITYLLFCFLIFLMKNVLEKLKIVSARTYFLVPVIFSSLSHTSRDNVWKVNGIKFEFGWKMKDL